MENNHHHHGVHGETDAAALADLLDLDASVLSSYLGDVTAWVHGLAADGPVRRVLDLGAGTGTGTIALAERFGHADVVAVDVAVDRLTRVQNKAVTAGFAERVSTVHADLNAAWPPLDPVDVVWAASSLHEMADPERLLNDVFAAIRPGGLFAVIEMDAAPRFLPDDIGLGRPGLESRCHQVLDETQADGEPHPDWGPSLEQTGFTILAKRIFTIDQKSPQPPATGRYARAYFGRIRPVLEGRMAADDLAALDTLLGEGPDSLLHRADLTVRGTRTAWAARRP